MGKVVFIIGENPEGYYVQPLDLEKTRGKFYTFPKKGTVISDLDRNFFVNSDEKVFVAVDTGKKSDNKHILTLQTLSDQEKMAYTRRTMGKLERTYNEPFLLGEGEYGRIEAHPSFIVKQSKIDDTQIGIPRDVLTEIAIYRLLSKNVCVPEMYGFDEAKDEWNIQLAKGAGTIERMAGINTPEQLRGVMWKLLSCMQRISSAGIIHRDLKPQNIIVINTDIQIIDWGISSVSIMPKNNMDVQSLLYRSPEVLEANIHKKIVNYTYKIDIFSIGMIFLYLLRPNKIEEFLTNTGLQLNKDSYSLFLQDILGIGPRDLFGVKPRRETIKRSIMSKYGMYETPADFAACMLEPEPRNRSDYRSLLVHEYFSGISGENPQEIIFPRVPEIDDIDGLWERKGGLDRKRITKNIERDINDISKLLKKNYGYGLYPDIFQNIMRLLDILVITTDLVVPENIKQYIDGCFSIVLKLYGDLTSVSIGNVQTTVDFEKTIIFALNGTLLYKDAKDR